MFLPPVSPPLTLSPHADGGIKRIRVIGRRAVDDSAAIEVTAHDATAPLVKPVNGTAITNGIHEVNGLSKIHGSPRSSSPPLTVPAVPLTSEAFAKFGNVIQAWADPTAAPKGVRVTSANQGTAHKFHRLARVQSSYPEAEIAFAIPAISVFRSTPVGARPGAEWSVKLLERHPYTSQAFIPMGHGRVDHLGLDDALSEAARAYLVVVALNGIGE